MASDERSHTFLPILQCPIALEGCRRRALQNYSLTGNFTECLVRKHEDFRRTDVMPSCACNQRNAILDVSVIEIAGQMRAGFCEGGNVKSAIGQALAQSADFAMKVFIGDGVGMDATVIVLPTDQTCPPLSLGIAGAAKDFERRAYLMGFGGAVAGGHPQPFRIHGEVVE